MEIDNVTQVAFIIASILSLILTGIFIAQIHRKALHWSFAAASAMQTFWLLNIGLSQKMNFSLGHIMLIESAHIAAWILATTQTIRHYCQNCLPKLYTLGIYGLCGVLLSANAAYALFEPPWLDAKIALVLQGIVFSIVALLNVEQLYRNVQAIRLIKLLSLNLAAIFIYDVYFFSQHLVQPEFNSGLYQIRAVIAFVTSAFMGIAAITLHQTQEQTARLSLSRPVVFYTTSLTLACALLALIMLGGYYVRMYGGDWGTVAYSVLFVGTLITIILVFASRSTREKLTVLINKHLFSHKYDYRTEWLKLIERLSQPTSPEDVHRRALSAVATIFKSAGGALWLRKGKVLVPVYQENISINVLEAIEPDDSPFIQALEQSEWVFLPSFTGSQDPLAQNNEYLPEWANRIVDIWLILPLLNESELIGFMVLTSPNGDPSLNWEDLDLLKTVGRQIANYLERHEQAEQLAEARQFDAFNKLAAYVMHDLKNLIAQQSLVVKNAEKHKDNPAFVEDAIQTIHNSVTRMNNLLRKLQRNEPEGVRVLNLNDVLVEAIRRCQKGQPVPTLRNEDLEIRVKGDWDSLVMVFVHLIQNAQDATQTTGFIDLHVSRDNNVVSIAIEDNGEGMDEDFIRNRLFKPFDTTKTGKGMGIGVYQARDYVQNLGGNLSVESTKGEGTTFTISLPITQS
ncbi:PEP-CTERM system histidine kinase PrsK [Saccharophagus sp. K07]|uniref:XrtA/PEP-CTERM system histidine kinase PrsK n=1 Tax=Saccharophagus sp. K07 TaxID=2283636 RepID=UPI001652038D|nr:XrtA/PEP-CTERM system histidine kinase PrsK [Saccharophagus sp. K07]MBC6903974.1 PEP-CTERM system histidine kinase PrsK [Saccharophagus sp. K07]